jgi:hypothetical protein
MNIRIHRRTQHCADPRQFWYGSGSGSSDQYRTDKSKFLCLFLFEGTRSHKTIETKGFLKLLLLIEGFGSVEINYGSRSRRLKNRRIRNTGTHVPGLISQISSLPLDKKSCRMHCYGSGSGQIRIILPDPDREFFSMFE